MFGVVMSIVAALALGFGLFCLWRCVKTKELADLFVSIGAFVLAALALLLATQGLAALQSPLAAPLGALVPLLISLGVVKIAAAKWWKWYAVFVLVGLIAISVARTAVSVVHSIAGLVIVILPIYAVLKKKLPPHFIGVSIGGVLIGIGGVALASAVMARPILPLETVVALLPWILLLMTVFYAYGFILGVRK
ncbi:hypothetical protein PAE3607 [Pyrobaculum aerophilum str. IM2]|uniref:Uncharacterized protein n=1 Tax=Pyrobaculum aerophilum (strain ATCC 51768 / DSM 7523 / JCM 9630 / CIP 104966 / NBRC 100827 / IM2) TaxID=178306 RepID=Q8ZSS5_PYRAE|nr:hypothetical protein [Pyrobaculum aerophilum]AAL65038.1 hypothetical protein PAE3607 [Pyrobaculum aerophilum str. IM2]